MRAATEPVQRRPDAKLLVVHADGVLDHTPRGRLAHYLSAGDLVVANDAATIPASLGGVHESSGAPIEIRLAGRPSLALDDVYSFSAVVFGSGDHRTRTEHRAPPPGLAVGDALTLGSLRAIVTNVLGHPRLLQLSFTGTPDGVWAAIARHGRPIQYAHIVPPLMMWDVWTRVASRPVAFEPPSASFVIDWAFINALQASGVAFATVTHAAGISSTGDAELDARLPLDEAYDLPETTVRAISTTKAAGGRVVALGTTVARALEHAASVGGALRPGAGLATQRIGPHTELQIVDGVVSGAHAPGESHYELLRAFANDALLQRMNGALRKEGYRSHEFGDSVLVMRQR